MTLPVPEQVPHKGMVAMPGGEQFAVSEFTHLAYPGWGIPIA